MKSRNSISVRFFTAIQKGQGTYGKCPACAIFMKFGIPIYLCMLIKSLHNPTVVGPTVWHTDVTEGHICHCIIRTFGDLCRSNGGSYDFGTMETFDQHAKTYLYAHFHRNRTGGSFPIRSFPYPDNGTLGDVCRSSGGSTRKAVFS